MAAQQTQQRFLQELRAHLRPAAAQAVIASDASPFGGGALLFILPANVPITIQTLEGATPWAWMATPWRKKDEHRAQAWIGDAAGQARWEAYASISAVKRWAKPALEARGGLTVVGDALGVLWGESVLRSKDAHINKLFMELALVLAPGGSRWNVYTPTLKITSLRTFYPE